MLGKYEAPEIEIIVIADIISASGNAIIDSDSSGIIDGGILG